MMEADNIMPFHKLDKLPKQVTKCPDEIFELQSYFDKETGLSTDEYLNAPWRANLHHYMMNVVLRIKQIEKKSVGLSGNRNKEVCNILGSNGTYDVQITAWEPYSDHLSELKKGEVNFIYYFFTKSNLIDLHILQYLS